MPFSQFDPEHFKLPLLTMLASIFGWTAYSIARIGKRAMGWSMLLFGVPCVGVVGFVVGSVVRHMWPGISIDLAVSIGSVFGAAGIYWMERFIDFSRKAADRVESNVLDNVNESIKSREREN